MSALPLQFLSLLLAAWLTRDQRYLVLSRNIDERLPHDCQDLRTFRLRNQSRVPVFWNGTIGRSAMVRRG